MVDVYNMTNDNIDKLIQMNQRLLLVMGYATSVILELGKFVPEEKKQGVYWVIEAIENIVYLDKPLPPMP
jgi:hypothetical protein